MYWPIVPPAKVASFATLIAIQLDYSLTKAPLLSVPPYDSRSYSNAHSTKPNSIMLKLLYHKLCSALERLSQYHS